MHCTSKQKENLFYFFFYFISFHFIVLYFILFYFILFHFTLYYFILFYFIYSLTIKLKGYQILMCGIIHLVIATRDMFNLSLFFCTPNKQFNLPIRANTKIICFYLCSEDDIGSAVLKLTESEQTVVEGSGAAGVAALLGGYLPELRGKR